MPAQCTDINCQECNTVEHKQLVATIDHPQQQEVEVRLWRSCCLETDKSAVVYIGQLVFSFTVLGFSAIMLMKANGDCEQSSPYIGLISFLLGKLLSSVTDSTR